MRLIPALVLSILIGNSSSVAPAAEPSAPNSHSFHPLPEEPRPIRMAPAARTPASAMLSAARNSSPVLASSVSRPLPSPSAISPRTTSSSS
jgi:hypothetical protein